MEQAVGAIALPGGVVLIWCADFGLNSVVFVCSVSM